MPRSVVFERGVSGQFDSMDCAPFDVAEFLRQPLVALRVPKSPFVLVATFLITERSELTCCLEPAWP